MLSIAILSLLSFFLIFFALLPLFGDASAWIAGFAMYVVVPVLLLRYWDKEWEGPVVKAGNYIIAFAVLGMSGWFAYIAILSGEKQVNALQFVLVYGYGALHYLAFGRTHFARRDNGKT